MGMALSSLDRSKRRYCEGSTSRFTLHYLLQVSVFQRPQRRMRGGKVFRYPGSLLQDENRFAMDGVLCVRDGAWCDGCKTGWLAGGKEA